MEMFVLIILIIVLIGLISFYFRIDRKDQIINCPNNDENTTNNNANIIAKTVSESQTDNGGSIFMKLFQIFKKKNDNDSSSSGADINSDNAVEYLRNKIIEEITVRPSLKYELERDFGEHVRKIFPEGQPWFCYDIFINLETGELNVHLSTYPNQFGACREGTYPLTASDLYQITKDRNRSCLKFFKTEEDWAKLFNKKLKKTVSIASKKVQKEAEKQKNREQKNIKLRYQKIWQNVGRVWILSK